MMAWSINDSSVKLAYKGPFYIDVLSGMAGHLRQMYRLKPITCNRLYKIFFELTQNVAKYSAEMCNLYQHYKYGGIGSFTIEEKNNAIRISTTNMIRAEDASTLMRYCTEINTMSVEALREYRSLKRRPQPGPEDSGAYIGIIQIGIITKNKIEWDIVPLGERFALFTITAKVDIE
ncbi:MAG TPA: SiaB family protein kinase [Bacteroidales bacterium]|nr:SiaB family protein kinase [Bacteroidales bacterium]HPO66650.1 SiaB family protein kinase [Bacteroidales bacterium]